MARQTHQRKKDKARKNKIAASERQIRQALVQALEELPAERIAEVLDFVMFLKKRSANEGFRPAPSQERASFILRTVPASHLDRLTGLVGWGGDAVADAEGSYEDNARQSRD